MFSYRNYRGIDKVGSAQNEFYFEENFIKMRTYKYNNILL
jgi:hypothetical protein